VPSKPLIAGSLSALAILLSGCSFCAGSGCSTSASDVAHEARQQLSKTIEARGLPPLPPVTCPHDLKNQAGALMTCYAKGDFGNGRMGVLPIYVTVTSVSGSTVNLHFNTGALRPLGGSTTGSQTTPA
jgi:hypothetical protein